MLEISGDGLKVQQLVQMLQTAATPAMAVANDFVEFSGRSSKRLHECLVDIIESRRTAQVNVDYGRPLGHFGECQSLNVTDALLINAGAPGMGVAIAIHEIWENFYAWSNGPSFGQMGKYGPAHAAALKVEGEIAQELTGEEGSRVASVTVGDGDATGFVLDYKGYFLVLKPTPKEQWATGRFTAAITERKEGASLDINGVTAGVRVSPTLIADVARELTEHPTATAEVYGMLATDKDGENAQARALAVRNAISVALDEDSYAGATGVEVGEVRSQGQGADLGARRAWTSTANGVDEATTVRVEIWEPGD